MSISWEYRYASRTQKQTSSAIRELLKLTERPDVISFAGGLPAPEVFPVEKVQEACTKVLKENGSRALQYGPTEGFLPLRELICLDAAKKGFQITPDNVLITSGSQQALDLIGKIFVNRGDHILVECPTYLGALQAWSVYGSEYVAVSSDENGIQTEHMEEALKASPKIMYILPNFQNPTGVTIPLDRREKIIELSEHYGVPIIEDDPYGQLRFEGRDIESIIHLDSKNYGDHKQYQGNVIYLSTFSKILAPGMRLAWVIAPAEVIRKMVIAKQGADLHTPSFTQYIAYEIAREGFIDKHVELIRKVYHERRDVMLESLEEHMPANVKWTHPQGGLFLWVTLPEQLNSTTILPMAAAEKVAYVPGDSFFPCGGGENTLRLNFSNAKPENINEGIARLGKVFKQVMTHS
jgi:2-aminoadipate transaminase